MDFGIKQHYNVYKHHKYLIFSFFNVLFLWFVVFSFVNIRFFSAMQLLGTIKIWARKPAKKVSVIVLLSRQNLIKTTLINQKQLQCFYFSFGKLFRRSEPIFFYRIQIQFTKKNPFTISLNICHHIYLFVCLFVCLSVCLFVCLSVCLFVCLSVCLVDKLFCVDLSCLI